ncbi:MAG TPA: AAA family ATPase [Armatimonadota bacterium]|nr:AAA family ATPase [Armatimonadota bacterium]
MKITRLQIKDYMGLSMLKLDELGKLTHITGGNGVCKSVILKAITEAMQSSGTNPGLIKTGAKKAEILLELDHRVMVRRTITQKDNTVKVVDDGTPVSAPTAYLKSLLGPYPFNPVDFYQGKAKERRKMLLSIIPLQVTCEQMTDLIRKEETGASLKVLQGVDFNRHALDVIEDVRKRTYDSRHEQGVVITRMRKSIEQDRLEIPETFDADQWSSFDFSVEMGRYQKASDERSKHEKRVSRLEEMGREQQSLKREIADIEDEIRGLKEKLGQKEEELADCEKLSAGLEETIKSATLVDQAPIRKRLDEYESHRELVNKLTAINKRTEALAPEEAVYESLGRLHDVLVGNIPRKLLEKAESPVKGLQFDEENILVDGVQLDLKSTSEQMRIAVEIAVAAIGKLRVICLDRFESLDEDARKDFVKEATAVDRDIEWFVTEVTGGPLSVV